MENNENYENQMTSLPRPNENVEEEEESGISLSDIWHMIVKHWVGLVIFLLVGFAGGFGYAKFIKKAKYQANVQLMVVNSTSDENTANINLSLQKTQIAYGYLVTDEVVNSVCEKMAEKKYDVYTKDANGKDTTTFDTTEVKKLYSVSIPTVASNSTSIFLSITSTCKEEQMAIDVCNFVVDSALELVNDPSSKGYSILNNSLVTMGKANYAKDTSTSTAVVSLIGALIGVVIGAGYCIIRELCDTHVSSKSDLEKLTGYKVIGMIPLYNNDVNIEEKGEKENAK